MTDYLFFTCPGCGASLKTPAQDSGGRAQCPYCKIEFDVRAPGRRRRVMAPAPSHSRHHRLDRVPAKQTRPLARQPGVWVGLVLAAGLIAWGIWVGLKAQHTDTQATGISSDSLSPALASANLRPISSPATAGSPPAIPDGRRSSSSTPAMSGPPAAKGPDPLATMSEAEVMAFQWGGPGDDSCEDMAARPDGRIVIVGTLASDTSVPAEARPAHTLIDAHSGGPRPFLAEISADGQRLNWVSLFGADLIEPRRVALAPDGSIYIGGRAGKRLSSAAGSDAGNFEKTSAAIVKVAADGARVLWVRAGGPNQDAVSGLAVDAEGRVLWTAGTRGRGGAAYVLRRNADGSDSSFSARPADRSWAIDLHHSAEDLNAPGQFWAFYKKCYEAPDGFDYDGPTGWGPVRFSLHGIRQGGQVIVLPNGDFIVSGTMQYDFRVKGQKSFPAFDLLLARYTSDGKLLWSTNLYQPNDSVHTPDQKAVDLAFCAATGDLYVLAKQHGSNRYRFKGDLVGDTGNMMISWLGRVDTGAGVLKAGYYFHHSRNSGYDERGLAKPPPYPKLSGNDLRRLGVDSAGRVYVAGNAGAKAWTTAKAWRDWPSDQLGGGNGALYVFPTNIERPLYVTMIRGNEGGRCGIYGLAVTSPGVWVGGNNEGTGSSTDNRPSWSAAEPVGGKDVALARFLFQ